MSEFKKNIEEYHDVSLDNIKCAAVNALPAQYRHKPWCITNKGGSDVDNTIYTEELQLNAYLASYTDWHKGKLEKAFALLNEPLPRQINIIDWACGQGMATLFILDYIKQNVLPCSIKEVILIEPSKVALERAVYLITKAAPGIFIKSVNKKINDVTANDLAFNHQSPIYQMFSNILDIGGIDHKHLTQILYTNKLYSNTLVCVSPYYLSGNFRINSFFKYFQRPLALEKHELLSDKNQLGYTYNIGIIKLLPNAQQQIIKYKFYPAVQFRAAYELSMIRNMEPFPDTLTYFDVYAPFDLGTSISDDPHPILAVLNNIITRGLATNPSPFIKVVENEAVHTVARERPLAADREQAAPVTDDLHLISRTQVLRRPGSPLDGRFREKGRIFGRIDDTLHAPVELRSQRSRIGGDGDPQIGIAPQQVGGQQGRSPDALAMLGRHGDDKPADAPGGECLQYAVVGLVKPPELQKGIDSGGKQAERRQIPRRSRFCGGQVLQYIYIHRSVVFKLRPVARRCRREAEGFDTHGSAGFQNRRIRQSQNSVQLFERQRKNGTARCSGYRKPRTMCSEKDRRRRRSGWDVRSCGVESEEVLLKLGKGEIVGAFPRLVGCMEFPPDGNQVVDSIGVAFGQTLLRTIDYDRGDETTLFRTVVE